MVRIAHQSHRTRQSLYSQRRLLHSQRGTALYKPGGVFIRNAICSTVYEPGNALFATRLAPEAKSYGAVGTWQCLYSERDLPHSQRVTELYKRNAICSTVKELQSYTNSTRFAPQSKSYRAIQTQHDLLHSQRVTELYKHNTICSTVKELQSYTKATRFAPQSKSYRSIETQRDVLHSQRVRALQKQRDFAPEAERYSTVRTGNVFIRNAILRKCLIRNSIYSTVKELQSYTNSTRFTPQSKSYRALQTQRDLLHSQRVTDL